MVSGAVLARASLRSDMIVDGLNYLVDDINYPEGHRRVGKGAWLTRLSPRKDRQRRAHRHRCKNVKSVGKIAHPCAAIAPTRQAILPTLRGRVKTAGRSLWRWPR